MDKILHYLIYNSTLASLLILFIFILRFIFKNKINPKIQYALWIIVVLRLILPSSLNLTLETKINLPKNLNHNIINNVGTYKRIDNNDTQPLTNTNIKSYGDIQNKQLKSTTENWIIILFIIWISVAICILSIFSICNLRFYKKT